jgi:hypothetical protein
MLDDLSTNSFDSPPPDVSLYAPRLPDWLARRLLRPGEVVTLVRGPRFNPRWERYVTHPGLFLVALAAGAGCLAVGRLSAGSWSEVALGPFLAAAGLVFGSIFLLGSAGAYFTRLVVTDARILIVQGYEVCRRWGLDDLPPSLVRYEKRKDGTASRSVDLNTLQTMLGGGTDQFTESKTILAFGKDLDRIKAREKGRPSPPPG